MAAIGTGPKINSFDARDWRTIVPVARCLADFTFGLVLYRVFKHSRQIMVAITRPKVDVALAVAILTGMFMHHTDILIVLLFLPLILSLAWDQGPVAAILKWSPIYLLGQWSYPILLVHYREEATWYFLSSKLTAYLGVYDYLFVTIIFGVSSIMVAILLHVFFDKPVQRLLRHHYDDSQLAKRMRAAPTKFRIL